MSDTTPPTLTMPGPISSAARRAGTQAGRDLAYLSAGLLTSIVAMTVWVTGMTVTASLAVLIVGIPVFLVAALAFRWTADLDRRTAEIGTGRRLRGAYAPHTGGLWTRVTTTARDRQTWRDLTWLVLHSGIGFAFGCIAICLVGSVAFLGSVPFWFWARDAGAKDWLWQINTLPQALAAAGLAIPLAVMSVPVLRGMAHAKSRLTTARLDERS